MILCPISNGSFLITANLPGKRETLTTRRYLHGVDIALNLSASSTSFCLCEANVFPQC